MPQTHASPSSISISSTPSPSSTSRLYFPPPAILQLPLHLQPHRLQQQQALSPALTSLLHLSGEQTPTEEDSIVIVKMPLVVPGLTPTNKDGGASGNSNSAGNSGGGSREDWAQKLMGKKISSQESTTDFPKSSLPQNHRVIQPGGVSTMDYVPERLNVHTDSEGVVRDVKFG